jgi:hypothetical protein
MLGESTLWYLQEFLQCIKNIILEFTLPSLSFITSQPPFLEQFQQISFLHLDTCVYISISNFDKHQILLVCAWCLEATSSLPTKNCKVSTVRLWIKAKESVLNNSFLFLSGFQFLTDFRVVTTIYNRINIFNHLSLLFSPKIQLQFSFSKN